MKIAIIGGGDVGRTLGVKLDILDYDVTIVESNLPKTIRIDKYIMYNITGDFGEYSHLVKVLDKIEELDDDYDIIFICTRLFDGVDALRRVRSKIKSDGSIVTIHNITWIDRAINQIDAQNAVFMHMDFSCYTLDDKTKVIDQNGVKLGIVSKDAFPQMQKVSEVLSKFCDVEQVKDIVGFTLGRNIINVAISLLGAVSGKNLGKILLDRWGRKLFCEIIHESMTLFADMNIKICPYNDQLDYYRFVSECKDGCSYKKKILKVLRLNNPRVRSSILFDLELNKKSEILTVVKSFIKHAQIRKIKIPKIVILYKMVNEIIAGKRRISPNVFNDKILRK